MPNIAALVMEGRGRGCFPRRRKSSLLPVRKASGGLPHGGGVRSDPAQRFRLSGGLDCVGGRSVADDPKTAEHRRYPKEQALVAKHSIALRVTAQLERRARNRCEGRAQFQTDNRPWPAG